MLLKNAKQILKTYSLMGGVQYIGNALSMPCLPYVNTAGTTIETITNTYYNNQSSLPYKVFLTGITHTINTSQTTAVTVYYPSIGIGTGTTAVTENDYKLENQITSGISLYGHNTSETNVLDENTNTMTRTVNLEYQIKNTSSNAITVSEVGLFQAFQPQTSTNKQIPTLLYREILDEPVTIEASAIGTFTYQFVFTTIVG